MEHNIKDTTPDLLSDIMGYSTQRAAELSCIAVKAWLLPNKAEAFKFILDNSATIEEAAWSCYMYGDISNRPFTTQFNICYTMPDKQIFEDFKRVHGMDDNTASMVHKAITLKQPIKGYYEYRQN